MLPLVVAVISLIGDHWNPASDLALEVLRIEDVGGAHTPLVGAQSRFGWDHPGPLMFWLLAPFDWVLGQTGLLTGAAVLNLVALVGALVVAHRRGGLALVTFVAVAAALLTRALGPALLIEPWNPWVPILPFLVYALLAWSVAERDWPALPWLVGVGSFVVQTHVGYTPVVLGLAAGAAVLAVLAHASAAPETGPRDPDAGADTRSSLRLWALVAAGVGVLAWLAPLVQQVTGNPGNLGEIVDSFRHPTEPTAGWEVGFGVMGKELAFVGPWITGDDATANGVVATGSTIPATVLVLVTAVLGAMAWRRGARDAGRLAALAVTGSGLGVIAVSRITGFRGPYLVRWSWVLAALIWLSIAWSLWSLLARRSAARATVTSALLALAGATIVGLTASTAWTAASVEMPQQQHSDTIAQLGPSTAANLQRDGRYLVTISSRDFGSVGVGLFLYLEDRGLDVRVERALSHPFGSWRTARRSQVDGDVIVLAGTAREHASMVPDGSERIATSDPLSTAEQALAQRLEREIRDSLDAFPPAEELPVLSSAGRQELVGAGADIRAVNELRRLREQGDPYAVYVAPAQPGGSPPR